MKADREPDKALDGGDFQLLDQLHDVASVVDPMPADLVARVQFAIALEQIDVEVCRLSQELGLVTVRGAETTRTVTFDGDSLSIMVTLTDAGPDRVRLDGWVSPAGAYRVEVRVADGSHAVATDAEGRFAVTGLPHGMAQVVVIPDGGRTVVTPSIVV